MENFTGIAPQAVILILLNLMLLNKRIQIRLKLWFYRWPGLIFLVSYVLGGFVCAMAARYAPERLENLRDLIIPLVFIYTCIPAFAIYNRGSWTEKLAPDQDRESRQMGTAGKYSWVEFVIILWLWLPIEIAFSGNWPREHFGSSAHIVAYGTAVSLGLFLFLIFGAYGGIKYNLPRCRKDFVLPLYGFIAAAAVLIPLGLLLGFIAPFHIPKNLTLAGATVKFAGILAGVALLEEILFRGLVQNWLTQKLGPSNKTLFLSALIFGAAHLNNGPGALPNWQYMALATVAGFIYGKVFQKSNSIFASAGLHAAVNTVRHIFFT